MQSWSHRVRRKLAALFMRWATRLEPRRDAEFTYAVSLVTSAENMALGTSGEYKHQWVYSRLLQRFPAHVKHELGLLVELAVKHIRS